MIYEYAENDFDLTQIKSLATQIQFRALTFIQLLPTLNDVPAQTAQLAKELAQHASQLQQTSSEKLDIKLETRLLEMSDRIRLLSVNLRKTVEQCKSDTVRSLAQSLGKLAVYLEGEIV